MASGRPLEHLISNPFAGHDLSTMQRRIKCGQLLSESQLRLTNRLDQDVRVLGRYFTGCPTLKRADRATAAGIRTARLLPHCCTVSVALLDMMTLQCINKYIHCSQDVNLTVETRCRGAIPGRRLRGGSLGHILSRGLS